MGKKKTAKKWELNSPVNGPSSHAPFHSWRASRFFRRTPPFPVHSLAPPPPRAPCGSSSSIVDTVGHHRAGLAFIETITVVVLTTGYGQQIKDCLHRLRKKKAWEKAPSFRPVPQRRFARPPPFFSASPVVLLSFQVKGREVTFDPLDPPSGSR